MTEEKPRTRKIKLAPALVVDDFGHFGLSKGVYASEREAHRRNREFKVYKWLINTPYEVEIEVPDAFMVG